MSHFDPQTQARLDVLHGEMERTSQAREDFVQHVAETRPWFTPEQNAEENKLWDAYQSAREAYLDAVSAAWQAKGKLPVTSDLTLEQIGRGR